MGILEINSGEELVKIFISNFIDKGKLYENAVVDAWCLVCDVNEGQNRDDINENNLFYVEDRLFDLMETGYVLKEFQTI